MKTQVDRLPFQIGSIVKFRKKHMCADMYDLTFDEDNCISPNVKQSTFKKDSKMKFKIHGIQYDEKFNSHIAIQVVDIKHKDKISDWMDMRYFEKA